MGIECALRTARLSLRRWRQYVGLQNEVVLRADGPNHDLGYPATVECVLSAASARRKTLSDDDALANLKIKVFTLADGHRLWVMLFDMIQHHPDHPAP